MPKLKNGPMVERDDGGRIKGVSVKVCPITMGNPTSMTEQSFRAMCAKLNRERKLKPGHNYSQYETTIYDGHCKKCGGKFPPELTIINIEDYKMTNDFGTCEICLRKEVKIGKNNGKKCCSTCAAMRSYINQRPEMALAMMQELAPQVLAATPAVDISAKDEAIHDLNEEIDLLLVSIQRLEQDAVRDKKDINDLKGLVLRLEMENAQIPNLEEQVKMLRADRPATTTSIKDTALLDIAIGMLSGEVSGLHVDKLIELRKAA